MTALAQITQAGYSVSLNESGNLWVVPGDRLTKTQVDYIKAHKAEIIAELTAANDQGITETERAYLTAWLTHIGETDPDMISEFWHNIHHKPGAKDYFLQRAMSEASLDFRRHCHECGHFTQASRYCVKLRFRPVDDMPRNCGFFNQA